MVKRLRYLLFAGDTWYPGGGWDDFRGAFATIDEAKAADLSHYDWAHIIDLRTMTEVWGR
jgi:hypothetical protein